MQLLNIVTINGFHIVTVLLMLYTVIYTVECRVVDSRYVQDRLRTDLRSKRYTLSIPKMHLCQRSFQKCGNGYGGCGGHCPPNTRNVCSRSRGYCVPIPIPIPIVRSSSLNK